MAFSETIKLKVKRRAYFICCLCHSIGVEVHHIQPQSEGGDDTEENAAPLCPTCHETYGANPTKRKFIIEARNLWYDICKKRFASDPDRLDKIGSMLNKIVTKKDLDDTIEKITELFIEIINDPDIPHLNKLQEISSISGIIAFKDIPNTYQKAMESIHNIETKAGISAYNIKYFSNTSNILRHLMNSLQRAYDNPDKLKMDNDIKYAIHHINKLSTDSCEFVAGSMLANTEKIIIQSNRFSSRKKLINEYRNALYSYNQARNISTQSPNEANEQFIKTVDICKEIVLSTSPIKKFELITIVIFVLSVMTLIFTIIKNV
ncbi:HNH endonuclease [bacterium]|nr:HNH endonuclease [bacterium]